MNYDVVIIGAGAAGLSAALWCDELGLKTILLEARNEVGGQLLWVYNAIDNHLGTSVANGRELRDCFALQLGRRSFEQRTAVNIASVDLKEKDVILTTGDRFSARALVIATGVERRKLGIAGENEFRGRGILESGKRDANLIAGKTICVIGGGDAAAENALILAESAKQVYLIHRRQEFRARPEFLDKISKNQRIKVLLETQVKQIKGNERIESIEVKSNNCAQGFEIPVDAVIFRIGVEPNTKLFHGQLKLDADGYVEVNALCETNISQVYAIGDVANPLAPTVSGAVGSGATAAKVIAEKLRVI